MSKGIRRMKIRPIHILLFFLTAKLISFSQAPKMAWMHGPDTINQPAVYGSKGIPSVNNNPPSGDEFMTWTSGNLLWLFGGYFANFDWGNTLWNYNTNTDQWTWVSGPNTVNQVAIYGTVGVASINNIPGARRGGASWKDSNGNLWLFGGYGYDGASSGYLNDLWKYSTLNNTWTWIGGAPYKDAQGNYGTMGSPSTSNIPSARTKSACWVDNAGNFWLFGGFGPNSSASYYGSYNDLWKFNPVTNEWTWIYGSMNLDQSSNFGTKGVSSPSNVIGSRMGPSGVCDATGMFWIFGGLQGSQGPFNELWKYDPTNGQWTWISGSNTNNPQYGIHGTKGVAAPGNVPASRITGSFWTDGNNNLWLTGGESWVYALPLWKYNITSDLWTWVAGDTTTSYGTYGPKGVFSNTYIPGERGASALWKQSNESVWLYGGTGYCFQSGSGMTSDLWKIDTSAFAGINEKILERDFVNIYPNPNSGSFKLKSLSHCIVQVFNQVGLCIRDIELEKENNFEFNIMGLNSGVYFAVIQNQKGTLTKKIIVTN
jgi:hypothetical protein